MNVKEYLDIYCNIIEEVKVRLPTNSSELKRQIAQDVFYVLCKDRRTEKIQPNHDSGESRNNGARLSTLGQRKALHKFGITEFDKNTLTYEDASRMMEKLVNAAEFDKKHQIKRGAKQSRVEAIKQAITKELAIDQEIEDF